MSENEPIQKAKARWEQTTLTNTLHRKCEDQRKLETASGHSIDRLYLPTSGRDYLQQLNFPGQFPFTRGIHPTMYRGQLWSIRQYSGFGSAQQTNARFKFLLEQGTNGLSIAFDLPTQIGYDSDHPMAFGEVGKVGVAIDTLADMESLLKGIPLEQVSISMTINATAAILLAMVVSVARKQGVPIEKLRGTVQNDILKEYIARGTYIYPPGPSLRLSGDVIAYCSEHMRQWNPISISGYHIREAGATAVQEIAFTFANAIAYLEALVDAGLEVDRFAPRLSYFFAVHTDLFEEIAKFRAARRLYAHLMKDRFGARNPASMMLRFHCQTGGVTLTAQQPDNNVARVTLQALAAVLGGTQSLHTNSKDEAIGLPGEDAVTLALRTQQIIAYESGATHTVDPLGGSFFVESLTDTLETEARACIEKIDKMGGMVRAIEQGFVQQQIEEAAYLHGQSIETKERIVVGVNAFTDHAQPDVELFEAPTQAASHQRERLDQVRSSRDASKVKTVLNALEETARSDGNLMPRIIDAVQVNASLGEISGRLREVFGEHPP